MLKETEMMLLHEVTKLFSDYVKNAQQTDRSTQTLRFLLHHLAVEDGKSQLELAHLLHISPPSVSVALQKMESSGYITRQSDPLDLRSVKVFLTEKGRALDREMGQRMRRLDERALSCLQADERSALRTSLLTLRQHLSELIWNSAVEEEDKTL